MEINRIQFLCIYDLLNIDSIYLIQIFIIFYVSENIINIYKYFCRLNNDFFFYNLMFYYKVMIFQGEFFYVKIFQVFNYFLL